MSLESTRIKPGTGEWLPVAVETPAGTPDVEPVAYQRAPTLMAGASAGSQGQVRVWAPSRKLLWGVATGTGFGSLLLIILSFLTRNFGSLFASFAWVFVAFFISVAALRRPCYVTTDDAGIGIATRKGSRTLRWSDILTVEATLQSSMYYDHDKIILKAPDSVEINLTGYPVHLRHEILNLIVKRAGLKDATGRSHRRLYVRPGNPALYSILTPPALNPGDGGRSKDAGR